MRPGDSGRNVGAVEDDPSRIDISNDDIRAARRAWVAAESREPGSARTAVLHESYRRLVSAQSQQIADDFRRQARERQV